MYAPIWIFDLFVKWSCFNLQSLKPRILDQATEPLVKQVLIPGSGWSATGHYTDPRVSYNPNVFRNATGVLRYVVTGDRYRPGSDNLCLFSCRNVSAVGERGRQTLRHMSDLVDSLVHFLTISVQSRKEYDTKTVQNVVCVLRNLSYKSERFVGS